MFPRQRIKLHPYRVAFWTAVLFGVFAAALERCPVTLDAGDPTVGGRYADEEAQGDVVVVLSSEIMARGLPDGATDTSWAWVDAIRQEIGPVATVDVSDLTAEVLAKYRTAVVTRGAALSLPDTAHPMLDAFATGGGQLVIELPEGALRTRYAADGGGGWRRAGAITAAEGVADETRASLAQLPLLVRYRGSTRPLEGATTLMAIDGAPTIYARRVGNGAVTIVDFEFTTQVTRMQQGVAADDGTLRARTPGGEPRTSDLVASPQLLASTIPYADLLERFVVHVGLAFDEPAFAFWPFPEGKRGALLSSHEVSVPIGRPLWMSIHERSLNARTSTFVSASSIAPGLAAFPDADLAGHAAMLWEIDPEGDGLYTRYGMFGFHPIRRPLTLVGQLERLEQTLGEEADVRGIRVRNGRWTTDRTGAFAIMQAAELRYSATYGPGPSDPPGYVFGTCQPFTPLDATGLPFHIKEIPVCFDNPYADEDLALFREAMDRARADGWAVHMVTAADRFLRAPDLRAFDIWREALRIADRQDMWVGGAGELLSFQNRRAEATLHRTSVERSTRPSDGELRAVEYVVEVETSARGLSLLLPATSAGLPLEQVSRGTGAARAQDIAGQVRPTTVTFLGVDHRLVALNPGFTTLGIRYAR